MYCNIQIDKADMDKVMSKLRSAGKNTPKHLKNAINRTVSQAVKQIKDGRKNAYTIKARRFNDAITVQKATPNHLDATIRSAQRPPTLINFKHSMPKSGGKADITKTGLKSLRTGSGGAAFIPKGGQLSGFMVQRKGRERYPLRMLYGPSVPKMIEKIWEGVRGGQGNLQESVHERLHEEILAEIAKMI